jgi:hypothetical protein
MLLRSIKLRLTAQKLVVDLKFRIPQRNNTRYSGDDTTGHMLLSHFVEHSYTYRNSTCRLILTPTRVTQIEKAVVEIGRGHAVAQLVDATSRKVAGSIPDGVIGIFL